MTVTAQRSGDILLGLSTDSKPTGLAAGALFMETDTGLLYVYSGSAWILRPPTIGTGIKAETTVTRPANTTGYTALDVVGATAAAITFAFTDANGDAILAPCDILLTDIQLLWQITAVPSGMTTFTLYLYSVTPPSALADNAAFDLPSGDRASYVGRIQGITPSDVGSSLVDDMEGYNKRFRLASSSLFGYLVTAGAYTPASGSVYRLTLQGVIV